MGIFFTFIFILSTVFSLLQLYQVYRHNIFMKKQKIKVGTYNKIVMLVPCYNEEVVIDSAIQNFSKLKYPNLKVIFINDGSNDNTFNLLKEILVLKEISFDQSKFGIKCNKIRGIYRSLNYPNMMVIDKENGGKADSLNAGINLSTVDDSDFIATLDADSILKDDALEQINSTLQNKNIIAVGGNIIASQGIQNFSGQKIKYKVPRKIVESIQFLDYLKGFFITKNSYASMKALAVISGAFGVFKKDVVLKVGGFTKSIGEDIDITIKFHRYAKKHNKKIAYNDEAICFTEVPNNWGDFFKQRIRWEKGFLDAFKNHYKFLFKNIFRDKLSFFMIFENLLLSYVSIICMIIGVVYYIYDICEDISVGNFVWIVLIIGLIIYLIYNATIFTMVHKSTLTIDKKSIIKILVLLIYDLLIFRIILIIIHIWGGIEYFFKPNSWNKVARCGANNLIKEEFNA